MTSAASRRASSTVMSSYEPSETRFGLPPRRRFWTTWIFRPVACTRTPKPTRSRTLAFGESLTIMGKLLGHTRVQTTAHLARDSIQTQAARTTGSIGGNLMPDKIPRQASQ